MGIQDGVRIDNVGRVLAHHAPSVIQDRSPTQYVAAGCAVMQHGGKGVQAVGAALRSVNRLADVTGLRSTFRWDVRVFEGMTPLSKRRGSRIEPAVHRFRYAAHFPAAVRGWAGPGHIVNEGPVQIKIAEVPVGNLG